MHTITNIVHQIQNDITGQESFGKDNSSNGRVVQGTLKPLVSVCIGSRIGQSHHITSQGTDPFASHGVSFVGHGTRPNLGLGKGFFDLFQVGQQTDITAHFVGRLRDSRKNAQNVVINLSCVGLINVRQQNHLCQYFATAPSATLMGREQIEMIHPERTLTCPETAIAFLKFINSQTRLLSALTFS